MKKKKKKMGKRIVAKRTSIIVIRYCMQVPVTGYAQRRTVKLVLLFSVRIAPARI